MTRSHWKVAGLLFFSGLCALIYQTVWLRQFRLIFGASTYATGAVLAIFMGGLGLGSALLGKRADAKERPLRFYAHLELMIAAAAALSPLLLWLAAKIYFSSGGSPQLGVAGATLLRLVLSIVILGPATLLMGGTLPAAARAIETNDDAGRRAVALLYGINTLGAVAGTLLSTFVLLETFGNRKTLLMAVLVNVLVGVVARSVARSPLPVAREITLETAGNGQQATGYVYAASAIAGFAFLLMELVWYRMLSPILGGTTYMFGLILAVALVGIGLGGAAYAAFQRRVATAGAFAITCSLEALAVAFPFALGDRLAIFANVLRNLGVSGFGGYVLAWTIVTFIVVFPAAFIAGVQFPLLIALLGRGRENVGRQIGAAYAWNTAGAIAGSLAGGFGFIPLLSAPGTWRLVAILLAALAVAALLFAVRSHQFRSATFTGATALIAVICILSVGPTAVWRHSAIGAGRAPNLSTRNEMLDWVNDTRRVVVWERDGRESSVALVADVDYAFVVNGKTDGSSIGDAGTQVMLGLVGAALHPRPQSSLVVGLGTGSTAGWLAAIPEMQRVDVAELEPVVLDVARACHAVNANAMNNPKVHITIADAREMLLTSNRRYDLIASEPSNPYRAGIASLFTREFYEASSQRLNRGGYFLQWVQTYGIDSSTMQTIYATITGVFPHVQTWQTTEGDLVLLASRDRVVIDANALRQRLSTEPYRSAIRRAWMVDSAEGFLGRLVANEDFARAAAASADTINTDDQTAIEFGFARSLASRYSMTAHVVGTARSLGMRGKHAEAGPGLDNRARSAFAYARRGDAGSMIQANELRADLPADADAIIAELLYHQNKPDEATQRLARAFMTCRRNPWIETEVMSKAFDRAMQLGLSDPRRARVIYDALSQPFASRLYENARRGALSALAARFEDCGSKTLAALRDVEPHPYWNRENLALRARCYQNTALAERALEDLELFDASEPAPIVTPQSRPAPRGSS